MWSKLGFTAGADADDVLTVLRLSTAVADSCDAWEEEEEDEDCGNSRMDLPERHEDSLSCDDHEPNGGVEGESEEKDGDGGDDDGDDERMTIRMGHQPSEDQ